MKYKNILIIMRLGWSLHF